MPMTAPSTAEFATAKQPGDEPLPGYVLIEPLGRGGFGEVWKCEAPGGLHKAIKFVPSDEANHSLQQEYDAFQSIKLIRHPFLLQLERVELTTTELIMVMELADSQLQHRYDECRAALQPGIPRDELLAYLADAAEALDLISGRHGLQHLDVKPANLFIMCGRCKVGDYGLVRAETTAGSLGQRGFTPRYVAPEVLSGRVDSRSDQYSLALVFMEMLTGHYPFPCRSAQQLMLAHASMPPDLHALAPEDLDPIKIALAKRPEDRYTSCLAFVQALMMGTASISRHDTLKPNDTAAISTMRLTRSATASGFLSRPSLPPSASQATPMPTSSSRLITPGMPPFSSAQAAPYGAPAPQFGQPNPGSGSMPQPPQFGAPLHPAARQSASFGSRPQLPVNSPSRGSLAGLPTAGSTAPFGRPAPFNSPQARIASIVPEEPVDLILSQSGPRVQLTDAMLKSVIPTSVLLGQAVVPANVSGEWYVNALMAATIGEPDALGRLPNGTWVFRFRSTHPISVARHKLESLKSDEWFDEITDRSANLFLLRRFASTGLLSRFGGGKKSGLEMDVAWPSGRGGEVTLVARIFGEPDPKFTRGVAEAMPRLFSEVKHLLKAGDERRKDARIPIDLNVTVYPMKDDGEILPAIAARTKNVSAGGFCIATKMPMPTRYVYCEFPEVGGVSGLAILSKIIRSQPSSSEHLFAGKFRVDLG
jgi:eukaryotic-like serine/threonine-protein kinase